MHDPRSPGSFGKVKNRIQDPSRSHILDPVDPGSRIFWASWHNPDRGFKFFILSYFGLESDKLKRDITELLSKFYPCLAPKIILLNTFSIGSFFKYKDRLPKSCQSAVIYQFCCASCGPPYVGSTLRNLHSRIQQHLGKSVRTGRFLAKPDPSPIRKHSLYSLACDTLVSRSYFLDTLVIL